MKLRLSLFFLIISTFAINLSAQTDEAVITGSGDKKLVSIPVSVSDREGRYIPNLKKENFSIYQDGVKQNISFFATYDEPLNIALLLDTSGSTQGEALEEIKKAAKEFIELLSPNDQCMIGTFDNQFNVLNPFTSDQDLLKKSINQVQTAQQDGTVLFRAIDQTVKNSFKNSKGRNVIVLLSDGKDVGSNIKKDALMGLLEESDVLIYTIFYQTGSVDNKLVVASNGIVREVAPTKKVKQPKPAKKPKGYTIVIPGQTDIVGEEEIKQSENLANIDAIDSLKDISETTAGRFYLSDTPNLRNVFKTVAGELRQQYRLGFQSKEAVKDIMVHDIIVKVDKADAVVRTRLKFRSK